MNNLDVDDEGSVTNYKYCVLKAAQYIKSYFDVNYKIVPQLEGWEVERYPVSKEHYQI